SARMGEGRGVGAAGGEPLYVLKLDAGAREVVVGPREALRTRRLRLREVNWLGEEPFDRAAVRGTDLLARIRSSGPLQPARLGSDEEGVMIELAHGEEGV